MKLLLGVSSPINKGSGISAYVREISCALEELGHEIIIASPADDSRVLVGISDWQHIKTDPLSDPIGVARKTLKCIFSAAPDAIINNDNAIIQSLAPLVKVPFISIGHLEKYSIAALLKHNVQYVDYTVAISSDMQHIFVDRLGMQTTRVPIIHNGVKGPLNSFMVSKNSREKLKIIFAGGYDYRKGGDLIAKMLMVKDKIWDFVDIRWYGGMPTTLAKKLEMNKAVKIYNRVAREDFLKSLAESDVFLMASRLEGCPMSMLEAMSYGAIPIASDGSGAMRWLVTHGKDGFICSLKDWPKQALECLVYLERNRDILNIMKKNTRHRFVTEFRSEIAAKRILDLLAFPTVDRRLPPSRSMIVHWHRPQFINGKQRIADRLRWRAGLLKFAGYLYANSV